MKTKGKETPSGIDTRSETSIFANIEKNQIEVSRFFLLAIHLWRFISPTSCAAKFSSLQYRIGTGTDGDALYDIGFDDFYMVVHGVLLLTWMRSCLMQYILDPIAIYLCKIYSKKARVRFAEQGWSFIYYTYSFIFGFYLYYHSSYWLKADEIYVGWPHYKLSGLFKKYYLITIAFWLQQIFILHIEKRRKDHVQMLSHHIITCFLLIGSYYYYYNRIGHLILMIMDFVDIFLAAAKLLKYSGMNNLCDIMFLVFLLSWVVLRHGVYTYLVYHAYTSAAVLMKDAQCKPGVYAKKCWSPLVINVFILLLVGMQILTMIWMYLILKVAYKVIIGVGAEDVRSDEDDTEQDNQSNNQSPADDIVEEKNSLETEDE